MAYFALLFCNVPHHNILCNIGHERPISCPPIDGGYILVDRLHIVTVCGQLVGCSWPILQ